MFLYKLKSLKFAFKLVFSIILIYSFQSCSYGQQDSYSDIEFTAADTLRGTLSFERSCYDVAYYELFVDIDIEKKFLDGKVNFHFTAMADFSRLQFDLFENLDIEAVIHQEKNLKYERNGNAVFVDFPKPIIEGTESHFTVIYSGHPIEAESAPWDGGFVWKKDDKDRDWVGVACEGIGASIWWPNKDHLSDEPDSMLIAITVPKEIFCASNGNLERINNVGDDKKEYQWKVSYPINNYNVSVNLGHYEHFKEEYISADGSILDLDYYVLDYNLKKAKEHFAQVPQVLKSFEHYFGKYPFWKDGYALVETPYLGMEHQSGIAYGNKYMRGYLGGGIPSHMDWDYIIVHETGHEYWGNSISVNDHAEMWIHESFTTYMEALFVEYTYSYKEAVDYLGMQRSYIRNMRPMVGPMNVNFNSFGSSDHYYKGSWVLHTLRNVIDNDELWFDILKSFYQENKISNVTSSDFITFVNEKTNQDLTYFFDQYLYKAKIPVLQYKMEPQGDNLIVHYKWKSGLEDFTMKIKMGVPGEYKSISPSSQVRSMYFKDTSPEDFQIAQELFLLNTEPLRM